MKKVDACFLLHFIFCASFFYAAPTKLEQAEQAVALHQAEEVNNTFHEQYSSPRDAAVHERQINEQQEIKLTVFLINQICYLYWYLKEFNDNECALLALYDEYDKLSLSSLELTKFKYCTTKVKDKDGNEKDLDDVLSEIQNFLMNWIKEQKTYDFYREMIESERIAARNDAWFQVGGAVIRAAGVGVQSSNGNWVAALSAAGASICKDSFDAYNDYRKRVQELKERNKKIKFELDIKKLEELHEYNQQMSSIIIEYAKEFNLETGDIISGDLVAQFTRIVKDNDPKRIFRNLNDESCRHKYSSFSMYWYYLTTSAVVAGEYEIALEAADRFTEVNSGLLTIDKQKAEVALAKMTAMIALKHPDPKDGELHLTPDEEEEFTRNLRYVRDANAADANPDWSYQCALIRYTVLKDTKQAKNDICTLILNLERNYNGKLVKYRDLFSEEPISLDENPIPIDIDLPRARMLYEQMLKEEDSPIIQSELEKLNAHNIMAASEKLYYVGDVRVCDLWKMAKNDVEAIKLRYVKNSFTKNEFCVDIPINWFLLGDVNTKIILKRNGIAIRELAEIDHSRKIRRELDHSIVTLRYKCTKEMLKGIDSIVLDFPHKSWPISITYVPNDGYSMDLREYEDETTSFVPSKISFMGEVQKTDNHESGKSYGKISIYYTRDWHFCWWSPIYCKYENCLAVEIPYEEMVDANLQKHRLSLVKDGKVINVLNHMNGKPIIDSKKKIMYMLYTCPWKNLRQADSVRFELLDGSVSLSFMPAGDYTMENLEHDIPFVQIKEHSRNREERPVISAPDIQFLDNCDFIHLDEIQSSDCLELYNIAPSLANRLLQLREQKFGTHYMATCVPRKLSLCHLNGKSDYFMPSVEIMEDNSVVISCTNKTELKGEMEINISYYSDYLALMHSIAAKVKLAPSEEDILTLKWPEELLDCKPPKYILIHYLVSKELWEEHKKHADGPSPRLRGH